MIFHYIFILFLITACGGGAGSGNTPQAPGRSRGDTREISPQCEITIPKSDSSLGDLALSAHRARVQCRLSEEDVLKLVK